jgi:hypothetical protein
LLRQKKKKSFQKTLKNIHSFVKDYISNFQYFIFKLRKGEGKKELNEIKMAIKNKFNGYFQIVEHFCLLPTYYDVFDLYNEMWWKQKFFIVLPIFFITMLL